MTDKIEWKVGNEIYVVPEDLRWRKPHAAVITKIGRKYATLGEGYGAQRADLGTGRVGDNAYSYAKAWPSKDAYENYKRLQATWDALRRRVDKKYSVPGGVSEEDIRNAMAILKINDQD